MTVLNSLPCWNFRLRVLPDATDVLDICITRTADGVADHEHSHHPGVVVNA